MHTGTEEIIVPFIDIFVKSLFTVFFSENKAISSLFSKRTDNLRIRWSHKANNNGVTLESVCDSVGRVKERVDCGVVAKFRILFDAGLIWSLRRRPSSTSRTGGIFERFLTVESLQFLMKKHNL